jgi:hypothetical protein
MAEADRTRLRATFDEAAERYDRARPGHPRRCSTTSPSWPASGRAAACSRSAAGRGRRPCRWPSGAARSSRSSSAPAWRPSPAASWPASRSCRWPSPRSRTGHCPRTRSTWCWRRPRSTGSTPAVRVAKAADALRPGGALAVISTHHVAGDDREFFTDVQACYEGWDPETTPPGLRLPTAARSRCAATSSTARAGSARWPSAATSGSCRTPPPRTLELLRTYSGHIAMTPDARDGLFDLHRRPRRPPLRRAHHQALPDRAAGRARQALAVSGRRCRPGGRGRWRPARWRRSRRPVPCRRRRRPACRARRP